jgi:hypothetical protein
VAIWLRRLLLGLRRRSTVFGCGGAEEGGLECAHGKYGRRSVGQVDLGGVICSCQSCIREDVGTSGLVPGPGASGALSELRRFSAQLIIVKLGCRTRGIILRWPLQSFGPSAGCGQPATAQVVSLVGCLLIARFSHPTVVMGLLGEGGGFQARQRRCKLSGRSWAKWGHIGTSVARVQVGRCPTSTHSPAESWKLPGTHRTALTNTTCPAHLKSHTGVFALQRTASHTLHSLPYSYLVISGK